MKQGKYHWHYIEDVDVLLVSKDFSEPCWGDFLEGFENFIVIMRSIETDEINGVRILGAKKNLPLLFRGEENNG